MSSRRIGASLSAAPTPHGGRLLAGIGEAECQRAGGRSRCRGGSDGRRGWDRALERSLRPDCPGNRMRARVESRLATEGIAVRHLSALGHLSRSSGISYRELARRTSVTPQSMQATLNELEVIGTVARMTKGGRGRTATLFVTDEGKRLLAIGYSSYAELDALLTEHLDPEHLDPETLTTCCCRSWRSCGVSTPGDVDRGHLRFAGSRSWWRMRQQNLSAVPDSPARPTTSPQCGSRWFRRCAGKAWTPSCTDREADQRRGPGRGTSGLGGVW